MCRVEIIICAPTILHTLLLRVCESLLNFDFSTVAIARDLLAELAFILRFTLFCLEINLGPGFRHGERPELDHPVCWYYLQLL